jgi:hypothetical protein
MPRRCLLALALALGGACAGNAAFYPRSSICPEHRDLHCVNGKDCSEDRDRGCYVCTCRRLGDSNPEPVDRRQ